MPRPERPLESADNALVRFAADLRLLREKAGSPTYRELGRRAHYSAATLSEAASGRKLPTLAATLAYVSACGGDVTAWEARWRSVASASADDPVDVGESPYVGLAAFQTADADRFFGRESLTAKLVELVAAQRFVGVFGASGSGKSSLLRAGLVPALPGPVLVFAPGPRPIEECAVRLGALTNTSAVTLRDEFAADPANLWLRIRQFDEDLVLVVDQFEEAFTLASTEDCAWLVKALTAGPRVVIGVRADFYGHCGRYPELVEALERNQFLVGPMSPDELRRAITEPAVGVGAKVETALVTRLVADVAGQAAALPLVSHALVETWRRRRGITLSLQGYEDAGGIEHAIARTAEEVFESFDPEEQVAARRLFLRLIALGEGTEDTKRRVPRRDLDESLLERLAAARLITLDRDTVELTHEALIRSWPRLRDWIAEDREGVRIHRQLTDATDAWEAYDRNPDALYRGVRLAQARTLTDLDRLSSRERDFLQASEDFELAQQTAARRRARRMKQLLSLLTVLVFGLAGLSAYTVNAEQAAARQRNEGMSLLAAIEAHTYVYSEPSKAKRIALAAYAVAPTDGARDALFTVYTTGHGFTVANVPITGEQVPAWQLDSPSGFVAPKVNRVVFPGQHGKYELGTLSSTAVLTRATIETKIGRPVLSADGHTMVAHEPDNGLSVWKIDNTGKPVKVGTVPGPLFVQAVSPDGRRAVVTRHNREDRLFGTPVLVDLSSPQAPRQVELPIDDLTHAEFSPDGRAVAVIRGARPSDVVKSTVEVWELDGLRKVSSFETRAAYDRLTYSPDGSFLAVYNVTARRADLWLVSGPGAPKKSHEFDLRAERASYAFSEDGTMFAGLDQSEVRVWRIDRNGGSSRIASVRVPGEAIWLGYSSAASGFVVFGIGSTEHPLTALNLYRVEVDVTRVRQVLCFGTVDLRGDDWWDRLFPGVERKPLCP